MCVAQAELLFGMPWIMTFCQTSAVALGGKNVNIQPNLPWFLYLAQ